VAWRAKLLIALWRYVETGYAGGVEIQGREQDATAISWKELPQGASLFAGGDKGEREPFFSLVAYIRRVSGEVRVSRARLVHECIIGAGP